MLTTIIWQLQVNVCVVNTKTLIAANITWCRVMCKHNAIFTILLHGCISQEPRRYNPQLPFSLSPAFRSPSPHSPPITSCSQTALETSYGVWEHVISTSGVWHKAPADRFSCLLRGTTHMTAIITYIFEYWNSILNSNRMTSSMQA